MSSEVRRLRTVFPGLVLMAIVASVFLFDQCQARAVISIKENLDQVLKQWSCQGPKQRLVYLGKMT